MNRFIKHPRASYRDADGARDTQQSRCKWATCVLLACAVVIACQQALREPGTPPETRSPLFKGFESYETLEQAAKVLPNRAAWKTILDSKSEPRTGCPRFDEFTFEVMATDLEFPGTLRLQFINDRLATMLFTPTDFPAYVDALRRAGTSVNSEERRVSPATVVWSSEGVDGRRFVGWRDERFTAQINAWVERCS
jgi:hypothetical protein